MDKSWMQLKDTLSLEYRNGVRDFLDFAWDRVSIEGKMVCPCVKCNLVYSKTREEIETDLIVDGIAKNYVIWHHHGEEFRNDTGNLEEKGFDDMDAMLEDVFHISNTTNWEDDGLNDDYFEDEPTEEAAKFYRLLEYAKQKLYPGCENFSKLSFIVRLLHIKCLNGTSNKAITMVLELFRDVIPKGETLPDSFYEAKKIIRDLGLDYVKIDACPNDCMLYWKEQADCNHCVICGASRWKSDRLGPNEGSSSTTIVKKVPLKTLRYFPVKPRLQRLFMSSKTSKDMTWHHRGRVKDGVLRHPADSEAWADFDRNHSTFASDPRNVRLGLASDGFNPFGNMSSSYSTWPVILVPYNLPPWMCMKQPFTLLSLVIPGPKAPLNDIDVYLQPLFEELNELWDVGAETYDAFTRTNFTMLAAVIWTINDFPAYANLSGWSTKGELACPSCNVETDSYWLDHGKKQCFMGHRRWLPQDHEWRFNTIEFNNLEDHRPAPNVLSGEDVLEQLGNCEQVIFGKTGSKTRSKRKEGETRPSWKKKSIFFQLPYWSTLLIRHNLDVMHIEKNICESVVGTLLGMDGKTKDNLNSRLDLIKMKVRPELYPVQDGDKIILPPACYTMSSKEKNAFCQFLKSVKVPDGFSSNIARCAQPKERKLVGMKSHDYHVLMQRLLPLAIRGLLPDHVYDALVELSNFFKELCSTTLRVEELERLERQIAITLCKLERIFPPSFFDVMEHLPIHLAGEAKLAGLVQYRWNYFVERNLRTLKSYVRNKSCPEGSIAEGYLIEECLTFCSRYLHDIETKSNRPERNYDCRDTLSNIELSAFRQTGRSLGRQSSCQLSREEFEQARLYVLQNCDEVIPYIEDHQQLIGNDRIHKRQFSEWFEERISRLYNEGANQVSEHLVSLARGPDQNVTCYKGYIVNGFRFHTKDREIQRKTQNSGVKVAGLISSEGCNIEYYGVLIDIIELHYLGGHRIVLFKCDWWDVFHEGVGFVKDAHGFTSVNFSKKLKTNEPFVLACQAEQIFYVEDNIKLGWHVVVKTQPRDFYNMLANVDNNGEPSQQ